MDYMTAVYQLRDDLDTPERRAVLNRQDVNPPSVLVTVRGFDLWSLCGSAECSVHLYLVVGDRNDEAALLALSPLLAELLDQLDTLGLPVEAVEADQVPATDGTTPYPAFRIETHLTIN